MEKPEDVSFRENRIHLLEKLMDDYGESLTRLAITYVKDRYIAEDIVQDSFLKAIEKIDSFQAKSSYQTYMYRIVINGCHDYLRSWHHKKVRISDNIPFVKSDHETSEKLILEQDRNHRLAEEVLKLSVKLREVLILFYYQDFSIEEISNLLNVSVNTVKTRLFRARQKLKIQLNESGWEW